MYKFIAHDGSGLPYLWTVDRSIDGWRVRIWSVTSQQAYTPYTSTTSMGVPFIDETLDSIDDVEELLGSRSDPNLRGAARNLAERIKAGDTYA